MLVRNVLLILVGTVAAVLSSGCSVTSTSCDHDPRCAKRIIETDPDFTVKDHLSKDKDAIDWKFLVPMETGVALLNVRVSDPLVATNHGVVGDISVFDRDRNELARTDIVPTQFKYKLRWKAEAERRYFVRFQTRKGSANYEVRFEIEPVVEPPRDPCAGVRCDDGEECQRGRCVEVEPVCDPPCRSGEDCIDGECVKNRCPAGCDRGERCRKRRGRWQCLKDPCYKKRCPDGTRCSGGKCRKVDPCKGVRCGAGERCVGGTCKGGPTPPKGCNPACKAGYTCKGNTCEKKTGKISAGVITVAGAGGGAIATLSKGKSHGVKKNMSCYVCAYGGKIKEVYARRSRCKVAAKLSAVESCKRGSIILN